MRGLAKGWVTFPAFRKKYGIKKDGSEGRKLKRLDGQYKQNLGTDAKRFWILNEEMACIIFKVKYNNS